VAGFCLILCAAVLVLPQGRLKIGGAEAEPEFRAVTWTAMMFAAGMGAGLVFWGAAEPLIHTNAPPPGEGLIPQSAEARRYALALTQFHWGLHAWAIYGVAAIAIALASSRGGLILPSAAFGFLPQGARRAIDLVALFAVLFGIVASIGQGVLQVGAGLETIGGTPFEDTLAVRLGFLALLTGFYLSSAALGLRRGIAILSNINIAVMLLLAAWVAVMGPGAEMLDTLTGSISAYASQIGPLSLTLREPGEPRIWTEEWSLTYFLWWMAWTPFVGVFLARISRGRSLRAFVAAAVILPSVVTLAWFSVIGGAALAVEAEGVRLGIDSFETAPLATFRLLENLPLTGLFQVLTVLLVTVFLITSADSGAYVLAMFSEQKSAPALMPRLYWGAVLAVMSGAALLSGEGQSATRALAVAGAVPMTFLLAAQGAAVAWRLFALPGRRGQ
jgi:choline-glycine betaine transporter